MASRRPKGEGSIFRSADGRWRARLTALDPVSGLSKRVQVTGRTKTEAAAKLKALRARLDTGQPARATTISLADYTQQWLDTTLPASNRKVTTQVLYAGLATNHILASTLGRLGLEKVTPAGVDAFITQLRAKGLADSTVRQIYTIGRAILDAAVRDGHLSTNPFTAVPRPQVRRIEAAHLEVAEVYRLLAAAKDSRYQPLFDLMVNTAMRRGEALALQWRDVDMVGRTLFVRSTLIRVDGRLQALDPKSYHARRHVPLSDAAVRILTGLQARTEREKKAAAGSWVETGYVFTTDLGEPCDPRNALRALKAAAKAANLPNIGLHTLRHSAASVMLSSGVPIVVVSRILGHSGIEITVDIYGHLSAQVSHDAVKVLNDALEAAFPDAAMTSPEQDVEPTGDVDRGSPDEPDAPLPAPHPTLAATRQSSPSATRQPDTPSTRPAAAVTKPWTPATSQLTEHRRATPTRTRQLTTTD